MLGFLGNALSGALSYFGAKSAQDRAQETAQQNIALQKQFAQEGIQWKVADAQKAGVHPLYALGAQTHSFAPVSVGQSNLMEGPARAVAAMGQDISRAQQATATQPQRMAAQLQLDNMQLQNEVLRNQVSAGRMRLLNAQVGPAMPSLDKKVIPGQAQVGFENAVIPGSVYYESQDGTLRMAPSKQVNERVQDMPIESGAWTLNERILPEVRRLFGGAQPPYPNVTPGAGMRWEYSPWRTGWVRVRDRRTGSW